MKRLALVLLLSLFGGPVLADDTHTFFSPSHGIKAVKPDGWQYADADEQLWELKRLEVLDEDYRKTLIDEFDPNTFSSISLQ